MRILAVDDDSYILELIPLILAQTGAHDISMASSAEEALLAIEGATLPFDCFLFDIQMPGMDGIELCSRVRAIPQYATVSIIMLTAMTDRGFIDRAFAAGATDYATKPFDVTELRARLRVADLLVQASRARIGDAASAARSRASEALVDDTSEITISGVPNVVSVIAMSNYLATLSTSGLLSSQVFAIEADGFVAIGTRATTDERRYVLTEIADAIAMALRPQGFLMAHVKEGSFVCVSNNPTTLDPESLESEIGTFFDDKECTLDNGHPVDINFAVGQAIQPGMVRTQGAAPLFERAIARARARAQALRNAPRPPNIRWTPNIG